MPFAPGKSGNPGGRPKTKLVTDELKRQLAVAAETGDGRALSDIVMTLRRKAAQGEAWAVQIVFERLEGKIPQPIAGDDGLDPITVRTIVTGVQRHGE